MNAFLRELGHFIGAFLKMLFWTVLAITSIGMAATTACWSLLAQDNRFLGVAFLGALLGLKFTANMLKVK